MAIMETFFCPECRCQVTEARSSNNYSPICSDCLSSIADSKRKNWLERRAALSLEERVRLLEEYTYDNVRKSRQLVKDMFFG
jgi:reverse gyrase